jgi:hypothetical protein
MLIMFLVDRRIRHGHGGLYLWPSVSGMDRAAFRAYPMLG